MTVYMRHDVMRQYEKEQEDQDAKSFPDFTHFRQPKEYYRKRQGDKTPNAAQEVEKTSK